MNDLQDILKNVINSSAMENKKPQEAKDIYDIFVENGYDKDYKSFQKDVSSYFIKYKLSDKELNKISAGKANKVNRVLAGMFSALTISNTAMNNIYANPIDINRTGGHVAQTNIKSTDKNLWEKFKGFFQNKVAKGVGIGVAAVLTPAMGVAFAGGYNYFTSVRYKFSQIIGYCIENKGDESRNSVADQKYVNMLSDIIDYHIKEFDSAKTNNLSGGINPKTSEISATRERLNNFRLILSNRKNKVTIQRLGEIAADDFFLPILNHLEINSLSEFVSTYHIDTKTSLRKQLEEHKKESYDNQKELENLKRVAQELRTELKDKDAELTRKVKELEGKVSEKNDQLERSQQEMRRLLDEILHIAETNGKLSAEKEAELNRRIAEQARMLLDNQQQLTDLRQAMDQLRAKAKDDGDRISGLEHERDQLKHKSEEDDKKLQELRTEITSIKTKLDTANKELEESKDKSDKMQQELSRLNDALATLDEKEKDHIRRINALESERNRLILKNQEDEIKLSKLQEQIDRVQNTLSATSSAMTAETDRLKEELARLKAIMEELRRQSEDSVQKIRELELKRNELIEQNQKSEKELNALRSEIGKINAKLDAANNELKDSKDKSAKLQQELTRLGTVITELNQKDKSNSEKIAALELERDRLTSKNAEDEKKLETLQNEIKDVREALRKAESTVGTSKEEIERLKGKLADLETATEKLSDQAKSDKDRIQELEEQLKGKDEESGKDLRELQKNFEKVKKSLDETNDKVRKLEKESDELRQALSDKNRKLKKSEIRTLLCMLGNYIPKYYTRESEEMNTKVEDLKGKIIIGFSAFIFENRSPKAQALLDWLIGDAQVIPQRIAARLNQLSVIDVYNCIKYVLDESDSKPKCMDYKIEEYETEVITANNEYVRDSLIVQDLIDTQIRENKALWTSVSSITAKPSETIRYYQTALKNMSVKLQNPLYQNLIRKGHMDPDQFLFIYQYLLNIADTVTSVLPEREERLAGELKSVTDSAERELIEILEKGKKSHEHGNPYNPAVLMRLFEKLNNILQRYDVDSNAKVLDAIQKTIIPASQHCGENYANTLSRIQNACKYSNDAYVTEETRTTYEGEWFGDLRTDTSKGEPIWSGFIHYDDAQNAIVVAFHGTDGDRDLRTDVNAVSADCEMFNGAHVHAGFLHRYQDIVRLGDMREKLRAIIHDHPNAEIMVTGHSLGGALATLAALDFVQNIDVYGIRDPNQVQLITFCSPRVLSKLAVNEIGRNANMSRLLQDAIRIWRPYDFIPTIPMGSMGYKHFGISWCLDKPPENVGLFYPLNFLEYHSILGVLYDVTHHDSSLRVVKETYKKGAEFGMTTPGGTPPLVDMPAMTASAVSSIEYKPQSK